MNTIPLACDMNVFTTAEREKHLRVTHELLAMVQEIHESEGGFEFVFPTGISSISKLAEFIANERLCCPFLEFTLRVGPGEEAASLTLAGPEGTRDFLRAEFEEVFA